MYKPKCPVDGTELVRSDDAPTWAHSGAWVCPLGDHLVGDEFCLDCGDVNDNDDGEHCRRCTFERMVDMADMYRGD